jgi:hypothetical protein
MDNKKIAKLLLGTGIYEELRSRKAFNPLNHPFPMQRLDPVTIDWDKFTHTGSSYSKFTYIVSPTQRSGTNFLSHILDFHPELKFPESDNLPMEHCLYSSANRIAEYIEETLTFWSKWVSDDKTLDHHAKTMMASFGESMISMLKKHTESETSLILKTPDAGGIKYGLHLFPQAKFIFLIRDGRDTLQSFTKSWGGKGAFRKMSERWADRIGQILQLQRMAEESGQENRILMVKYEDLILQQNQTLRDVFAFLEKDESVYPWEQLESAPVLGSSEYKSEGKVHWKPLEKTEGFNPLNKWLEWSDNQKNTFKEAAGNALIQMGFEKDLNW